MQTRRELLCTILMIFDPAGGFPVNLWGIWAFFCKLLIFLKVGLGGLPELGFRVMLVTYANFGVQKEVCKIIGTPFLGEVYRKPLDGLMISCTYKGAVGKHDPIRGDCDIAPKFS